MIEKSIIIGIPIKKSVSLSYKIGFTSNIKDEEHIESSRSLKNKMGNKKFKLFENFEF